MAMLAVAVVSFATFDFLSFTMARGLLFVGIGCAGALWRLEVRERSAEPREARIRRSVDAQAVPSRG
jgi:hypothetical protein